MISDEQLIEIERRARRMLPRFAEASEQPRADERVESLPVNVTAAERFVTTDLMDLKFEIRRYHVTVDRCEQAIARGDLVAAAEAVTALRRFERDVVEAEVFVGEMPATSATWSRTYKQFEQAVRRLFDMNRITAEIRDAYISSAHLANVDQLRRMLSDVQATLRAAKRVRKTQKTA